MAAVPVEQTEDDRVLAWRTVRAIDLGLSYEDASRCMHELERLVRAGCAPELAARIVS